MSDEGKKPIWKRWWFWLIAIIIIFAIGTSGEDNKDLGTGTQPGATPTTVTSDPAASKATAPGLEVVEHSIQKDQYSTYIVGTVKNNSSKQYGYAQIEFNLYDASGAQVGSAMANINNLEPNGTWKFKALAFEDDFKTYKIKDVTGF